MEIHDILIMEEIKQVKALYCYNLDLQLWNEWGELFARDASLLIDVSVSAPDKPAVTQPPIVGREAIKSTVSAILEHTQTVHQVHSPIIQIAAPNEASAIWAMEDIVEGPSMRLKGRGHYHERYVVEDGRWRIASVHLTRLRLVNYT
jgi:hypothetical protein